MKQILFILCFSLFALFGCDQERRDATQKSNNEQSDPKVAPAPAPAPAANDTTQTSDSLTSKANTTNVAKPKTKIAPKIENEAVEDENSVVQFDAEKSAILVGMICLLFLVLIFVLYFANKKSIRRALRQTTPSKIIQHKIADLERNVINLQNQYNAMQNQRSQCHNDVEPAYYKNQVAEPIAGCESQIKAPNVLYFASPRQFDKTTAGFDSTKASQKFIPSESKYKLVINGNNTAQIEFIADDLTDIRNMPADFIDPVCVTQGQNTKHTQRIICLSVGQAKLDNGNWIVTEKLTLRYE